MASIINASPSNGIVQTADGSGILKIQSNSVTTNALAWVNFNGTTSPPTIRASYNVSSITKTSTGLYVLNLTNATSDANQSVVASAAPLFGTASSAVTVYDNNSAYTTSTSAVYILVRNQITQSGQDVTGVAVAVFGN